MNGFGERLISKRGNVERFPKFCDITPAIVFYGST